MPVLRRLKGAGGVRPEQILHYGPDSSIRQETFVTFLSGSNKNRRPIPRQRKAARNGDGWQALPPRRGVIPLWTPGPARQPSLPTAAGSWTATDFDTYETAWEWSVSPATGGNVLVARSPRNSTYPLGAEPRGRPPESETGPVVPVSWFERWSPELRRTEPSASSDRARRQLDRPKRPRDQAWRYPNRAERHRGHRAIPDAGRRRHDVGRPHRPDLADPGRALVAAGVRPGDRVAAYLPNIPETPGGHAGSGQPGGGVDLLRTGDGRDRRPRPPGAGQARRAPGRRRLPLRRSAHRSPEQSRGGASRAADP